MFAKFIIVPLNSPYYPIPIVALNLSPFHVNVYFDLGINTLEAVYELFK